MSGWHVFKSVCKETSRGCESFAKNDKEGTTSHVHIIHLFKVRDATAELFRCLRYCVFESKILFYAQSLVQK